MEGSDKETFINKRLAWSWTWVKVVTALRQQALVDAPQTNTRSYVSWAPVQHLYCSLLITFIFFYINYVVIFLLLWEKAMIFFVKVKKKRVPFYLLTKEKLKPSYLYCSLRRLQIGYVQVCAQAQSPRSRTRLSIPANTSQAVITLPQELRLKQSEGFPWRPGNEKV